MKMLTLKGDVIVQFEGFARRPIRQEAAPTLKDIYYVDRWDTKDAVQNRQPSNTVLLFSADEQLKEALRIELPGTSVISVSIGSHFEVCSDDRYLVNPGQINDFHALMNDLKDREVVIRDIVYAWDSFELLPILFLTQALMKSRNFQDLLLLYVYTRSSELVSAEYAMAAGFGRTLIYENPKMEVRSVETSRIAADERAHIIASELHTSARGPLLEVSYIDGSRKVRAVVPAPDLEKYIPKSMPFKLGGTYLITGGTGGLGHIFAKYLVDHYKANLILVGRSELNDSIKKNIDVLQASGSRVHYISADVTDARALQKAFRTLPEELQSLNGVIHAAGLKKDSYILKKDEASFNQVILTKVKGALSLDALTKDMKLDFMVLFSSVAALIPNQGQSDYAAANSFLDRFAQMRNKLRSGFTLAIGWPLWASGGMSVTSEQEEHLKRVFGMDPLPSEIGIKVFEHLLGYASENKVDQVIVISGDKDKIMTAFNGTSVEAVETAPDAEYPLVDSVQQDGIHSVALKEFTPNLAYVNGFSHQGKAAVPGACFLEMARQAAEKLSGEKKYVCINNNYWPVPLEIEGGKAVAKTRFTHFPDHVDFEISTTGLNQKEIVHATGTLATKERYLAKPQAIDLTKKMATATQVLKSDAFYETIHSNANLRLSGNFRPVQELYVFDMEAIARLVLPTTGTPRGNFLIKPIIFTGLEQALLVYTAITHGRFHPGGMRLMPVSIESVNVYAPFPDSCWVHISAKKEPSAANKIQRFDVTLYDDSGSIVAFVSGNTMRISPLENAAESKAIAVPAPSGNAEKYIKKILSEVLGIKEEDIDSSTDFERYGVTSQMIVELNTLMENDLGPVSKTLFFEFANVNELAAHLNGQYKDKFSAPILTPTAKEELTLIIREAADSDIAIIGMSGRFPEASSLSEYWNNLVAGRDSVTKGPLHQDLYQSELIERENFLAKWGGSIKDVEQFDPEFFGIAPKEGSLIDPQERLFLKVAWEALQDAGIDPKELDDEQRLIGVYVGALWQDYQHIALEESLKGQAVTVSSQLYSIANRVSYTFNFNGPSLAVDTACSSSLTALHLACQSLISGDSTAAIVGGVNLNLHPTKYAFLNHYNFLSSEGKCRSYGEGGDGYVPGEGIGALILKPLKDALRDGDPVHAVIKSSAINHGGKTRGYTVPNPALQSAVVLRAIKRANINPRDISYVEGHGTGTALGDPIEIRGLDLAYSQFTDEKKFCAIGSVKSNIGHLEAAAGVASVIKVVLQMAHRMLAPSLHSETLNKNIDFDASAFYVQRKLEPWVSKGPLLAAVSSFGAGGSYAHVIIEEAPSSEGLSGKRNPPALFSGKEEKYWIEGQAKKPESKAIQNPLLGERLSHSKDDAFQGELNLSTLSYLKDHQVFDTLIYPGSAYVEMILAAAVSGNGKTSVRVTDVSFESPLKFESGGNVATQTLTEPVDAGNRVSIYSQKDDGLWIAHARGTVTAAPISNDHLFIDIAALKERSTTKLDKTDFYRYVHSTGLNLGPLFQTVEAIYVGDKESFGEIKVSGNVQGYIAHPSLLDGCLQTLYASLWHDKESTLHLPIGFDTLELYAPLGNHVFAHWQEKDVSASGRSGDVTIYGPSGEILASIKGFHFRKTSERAVKQMLASESSIDDWFYEWTWKDQPLDDVKSSASLGYWLVIGDGPIVDRIQDNLRSRGEKFTTFPTSEVPKTKEGFAALLQTQQYAVIVHASGTTEGSEEITHDAIERAQEACCRSFLYLCQALTPMPDSTRPQVLLARSSSPIFATVDGLYKTVTLEHPELNLKQLILKEGWEPQHLVNAAYLPQTSTVLTLTKSRCLVGLLSKPEGRQEKPPEVNFQRDATYLITGGLGGLGISLAAWLADRMAGHIVIVGRRPSDENLLKSMERPDTRFSYVQCDISNERAVSDLISQLGESKNPLKGIFHLAGILDDATIMEQVWSRFNKVFASKLYGTYYLHKYAKDLDYFVLFSSIASTLGNPGQGNYAAANAFMDALCEFRKEKGLPGLSISWGPWAEIGMAKELTARHARSGWIGMKPDEAMRALEKALVMGVAHPTIAKIIWGDVLSNMSSPPEWLQNFREQGASHHEGIQLQDMLVGEREERIRQLVGEVLRACLGMASSQPIDPGKSFFEMGLDSLMVVEMRNRLQTELGSQVTLSTSTIFDHGSLAELSLYINSLLEGGKRSEVKETKLNRPTELIPHVKPLEIPELPILVAPFPPKTILVTGATGFLGAFLLKLLAEEFKDSKFYCLVRAENDSRAKERILDNLNRYRIDSSAYAHRITAIASDLLLPRFGIADSRYMELAAEVDMVVNSAAFLNWAFSYHALETFNVDSVREILTFATLHKVKDVHHISTIGVFPRTLGANQEIDEDLDLMFDGDISNNGISHGYFQSKWAAEVLVYEARKKGLKINLYRPSSLIGDSQYGIPSFDEFSCRMVEGCRQLGVAPENDTLLDIVPVDFAAEAIVRIIAKGHPRNENFNIINKNPISIRSLFAGLQEVGEPLKIIPRAEWDSLVSLTVTESPAHPLAGIISIIPGYLALTSPNYSCKNTLVALEGKRDITYIDANKLIRTFINGILDDAKKK
jgi:thioester reductase-like protein